MSNDIFGRRALSFGGAFAADSAQIELNLNCVDGLGNELSSSGLLTQQLSIQYSQPITRLYEVGTQKTYYVAGRPQGNASLARVLGPGSVMAALYECLGDVCKADANDMCFCIESNCLGNTNQDFSAMRLCLKNVVLQSLGFAIQAQDMIINEQMSLFFTALLAADDVDGCAGSQEPPVTCECFPANFTVTDLQMYPNPAAQGTTVNVRSFVTSSEGTPTGTVQFYKNGVAWGSPVTLVNGLAIKTDNSLAAGVYDIFSEYLPTGVFGESDTISAQILRINP